MPVVVDSMLKVNPVVGDDGNSSVWLFVPVTMILVIEFVRDVVVFEDVILWISKVKTFDQDKGEDGPFDVSTCPVFPIVVGKVNVYDSVIDNGESVRLKDAFSSDIDGEVKLDETDNVDVEIEFDESVLMLDSEQLIPGVIGISVPNKAELIDSTVNSINEPSAATSAIPGILIFLFF